MLYNHSTNNMTLQSRLNLFNSISVPSVMESSFLELSMKRYLNQTKNSVFEVKWKLTSQYTTIDQHLMTCLTNFTSVAKVQSTTTLLTSPARSFRLKIACENYVFRNNHSIISIKGFRSVSWQIFFVSARFAKLRTWSAFCESAGKEILENYITRRHSWLENFSAMHN